MNNHPKSDGAAFPNRDKKTDKHPDFKGHVDVTREQLERLYQMGQSGAPVKLQIAMWNRTAKQSGAPYVYIKAEAYMKDGQQTQQAQSPRPQAAGLGHAPQQQAPGFIDDDLPF